MGKALETNHGKTTADEEAKKDLPGSHVAENGSPDGVSDRDDLSDHKSNLIPKTQPGGSGRKPLFGR